MHGVCDATWQAGLQAAGVECSGILIHTPLADVEVPPVVPARRAAYQSIRPG